MIKVLLIMIVVYILNSITYEIKEKLLISSDFNANIINFIYNIIVILIVIGALFIIYL